MDKHKIAPEHTAVRVALWRALHARLDEKPLVFDDNLGEKIVAEKSWESRPDMNPDFSKPMRASIVGRARFIEDLVEEQHKKGVTQYIILGAGLDTFALRRNDLVSSLKIFEVDQPGPQRWKQARLKELGFNQLDHLHFVPVDFEANESWWEKLIMNGFDPAKKAIFVSTGVSMYLTKDANQAMLKQISKLPPGSVFAMTFMLSLDLLHGQERATMDFVMKKAQDSGTPFISLFSPDEILAMAKEAGFAKVQYMSGEDLYQKYFASRTDGLRAGHAEAFLVAKT